MKTILFAAALMAASSVYAQNCETAELVLAPSRKTAQICSDLSAWGPATIKACNMKEAELTLAVGGVYDMTASNTAWVSKTEFQDDDQVTQTTIFNLNLVEKTYSVLSISTQGRGPRLSVECTGKVQLKN